MQSAVDKILSGEFSQNTHSLDFSIPRIELSVRPNERFEGSFTVSGPENLVTEGCIYSNRLRMRCLTEKFYGTEEEIVYCFDATDLEDGENVKGEFNIISNRGEYVIPFEVTVEAGSLTSSLGDIRNLFHFTNLARTNWEEAVKLFYTEEFAKVFQGADRQHYAVYRGLCTGKESQQNVEEFLLEIKKKQKVEFLLEENEIRIHNPKEDVEYKIVINRNGWGFSTLEVETDCDFIVIEKETIRDEDFLGNCYRLPFYIAKEALHGGKNFGVIRLFNAYVSLSVTVSVHCQSVSMKVPGRRRYKNHLTMELMQYYEAFRSKQINATTWMQETEKIIDRLAEADDRDLNTKLFRAQLLITQERYNEADWLLKQVDALFGEQFEPNSYCYYLYLTTLIHTEEEYVEGIAAQVERIFVQNAEEWRIAWLLLYLSEEYSKSPSRKWMALEEQFLKGCSSPVLYIEAYHLILTNPTLLMSLKEFEQQVLYYAAKKDLLNPTVAQQIVYLAARQKNFSKRIFFLLQKCYELLPEDETLQVICTLLIKGNHTGREYFKWYALGIESKLRITRLYEYYMMSCDLTEHTQLPKIVLMYFAFDSNLDSVHNSFLYAYMYRHKDEYPELYENYRMQIERFTVAQALQGRNNKWLSVLYRNIFTPAMVTEEIARGLSVALFIHRLQIKRDNIHKIILVYEKERSEQIFTAPGKEVYLPVFGSDVRLLLEDGYGNRYCREEDYELERLIVPDKLAHMVAPYVTDQPEFLLWQCERGKVLAVVNEDNIRQMRAVAQSDMVSERLQKEISMKIIHYYYDSDQMQELDEFLSAISLTQIAGCDYSQAVRFLIIRGMYEKAYEWIEIRGIFSIEPKILMRLCSYMIAIEPDVCKPDLTVLTMAAFSAGKYDENILKYLVKYYEGTLKEMRNIWKAAKAFGVDTYEISSRILIQMLYTGAYISEKTEVFRDYVSGGARSDVELAVLSQSCFDYFVGEKVTDGYVMQDLQRVIERQEEIPLVCKLAYTRFYAENKKLIDENISKYLITFLRQLLAENLYFPYFKEYADHIAFMRQFADKTMIQHKLEEGSRAVIHYYMEKDGSRQGEYVQEEMQDMFYGICVKQFILFFGERLQYYVTETDGENEQLTRSGTLSRSDTDREQKESKYNLINDIAIGRTLHDDNTMETLLYEYYEQEFTVNQLFHII